MRSRDPSVMAFMLSCPGREAIRRETIERLRRTDWGDRLRVIIDDGDHEDRRERQMCAARGLLEVASGCGQTVLFIEDDLEFNRHLGYNVGLWAPLAELAPGGHLFGSLYNPTIRELCRDAERDLFEADPEAVYGSQAFLLAPATVRHVLDHWDEVEGMQDIKMSRLAAQRCPIYYHRPSLVQHVGEQSQWGGQFHWTRDFDLHWRAVPAAVRELALRRMREIRGWLSDDEGGALVRAAARAPASGAIVEVGSAWGRSTVVLATVAQEAAVNPRVHAVDPHEGEISNLNGTVDRLEPTFDAFAANIAGAGLADVVVTHRSRSHETPWQEPIGLLFVDGLHDYDSVARDTRHFLPWLCDGGLLAFHDCGGHFPGVQAFVDEMLARPEMRLLDRGGSITVLRHEAPLRTG